MRRLLLLVCLLAGVATAQPATMASRPCRMDGADCGDLPSQSGASGKYLTSNGTSASWASLAMAYSSLTGISSSRLLGRGDSGAGAAQEITLGTGLTMTGTTLDASGGSATPGGSAGDVQWNDGGTLAGGGPSWDSGTLEIPTNNSAPGGVRIRNTSDSTCAYSYIEFGDTHGGGFRQFGYLGQGGCGPLIWLSQPGWGLFLWTYGASDDITLKTRYVRVDGGLLKTAFDAAPASATDTGTAGEVRITATYIYVCTATNTWVRAALSTW